MSVINIAPYLSNGFDIFIGNALLYQTIRLEIGVQERDEGDPYVGVRLRSDEFGLGKYIPSKFNSDGSCETMLEMECGGTSHSITFLMEFEEIDDRQGINILVHSESLRIQPDMLRAEIYVPPRVYASVAKRA